MSLLDRLQSKPRRRVVVPVLVGADPAAVADLAEAQAALVAAAAAGEDTTALEARVDAAQDGSEIAEVSFTALAAREFEAVLAAHPGPDDGVNWDTALPVLAALCVDDVELQDDTVWAGLLPSWSYGEKLTLRRSLLAINTGAPAPHVPKG